MYINYLSFIQSTNLFSIFFMPGTVLGAKNTTVNQTGKTLCLYKAYVVVEMQKINKLNRWDT